MVKVRVTKVYFDKKRDEYQEVGKEFEVEEKRAEVLEKAGVCEVVKDNSTEETQAKETKKTSTKGAKKTTEKAETK